MNDIELRSHQVEEVRVNKTDDSITLEGYVAKFNSRSRFMGFYEEIDKRAFDNTLKNNNNIFALYNHDWDKVLASTRNGTLELNADDTGLRFVLKPSANTSFMNDVKELVDSGELRGMSFGFITRDDEWRSESGVDVRTLKDIDLKEVTLTPIPAYESTEVALRSYEAFKNQHNNELKEYRDEQRAKIRTLINLGGM